MNLYTVLVFLHVLGGVGVFVAMAVESIAFGRLRDARTVVDAHAALRSLGVNARLGPASMLTTVGTGIWMGAVGWSHQAWMPTALGTVVVMGLLGGTVTARRLKRVRAALAAESGDALSDEIQLLLASPVLDASLLVRIALGVGILALMTAKPALAGSLVMIGAAAAAGVVATGVLAPLRARRVEDARAA
ncbi:MAG TPA: hypothetical protein VD838_07800 [Anaeromyxobacteraceae bacterium]|nr:hypothetical protein [Anaeromyxobacteraceae bacterium]